MCVLINGSAPGSAIEEAPEMCVCVCLYTRKIKGRYGCVCMCVCHHRSPVGQLLVCVCIYICMLTPLNNGDNILLLIIKYLVLK